MSTNHLFENRDGFALPVALLAIMVIGAIVTGGFYASSQESRISSSTDLGNQAFYVAEYGLEEALGTWKNDVLIGIGGTQTWSPVSVFAGGEQLGTYTLTARRIGISMFLVTSEGRATAGPRTATRRVGSMVRTLLPSMPAPSAIAIFGGLTVGGSSKILGDDNGGPGCTPGATVPGVTAYDTTLIDDGAKGHIKGDPAVLENTAMDTTGLSDFGAIHLNDIIAAATRTYAPGETENGMGPATTTDWNGDEICDTSVKENWGDPTGTGPCSDEFPIIYAEGDLQLKTGTGQGILIVEGDLKAAGNFDFYGIIIVKGEMETTGTGNHMEGSVIVQGQGLLDSESTTLGNSLVQYSRCRVERAFNAALRPRPLAARSWMDFTAVTRGS